MKRNKFSYLTSLVWLSSLLLTGCFDDSSQQCKTLVNDEKMKSLALSYCEKAANNNDPESQYYLATLLFAENQSKRAVEFLHKSANQKYGEAAYKLGELYETDLLGEKDSEKARFYYDVSCQQNTLKGCQRAGALAKEQSKREKADEIALERAKAETLAREQAKLEAEAKAREQERLNEEDKKRRAEEAALKAKVGNRKFYEGLAKFKEGDLWGHINKEGKFVIPPQWAYAADFYDGLAAVKTTSGKWGFIDTSGNYQIYPQFSCVVYFNEGVAAATLFGYGKNCQGGKWGFIDKQGRWVIQPVLDEVLSVFRNGIAKVTYASRTGYINKQGQWVDYQEE